MDREYKSASVRARGPIKICSLRNRLTNSINIVLTNVLYHLAVNLPLAHPRIAKFDGSFVFILGLSVHVLTRL